MADIPSDTPEWASSPPGDTITTPSATQRAQGWQPRRAQVSRLQVTTVANSTLYRATVNGVNHDYTSDGSATATEIRDGVRNAINAGAEPVTAANDGADALTITADVAGVAFTLAASANLTATTPTPNSNGRPRRQFMNWLQNLVYQWVLWLRQAVFRSSDLAPDQAFGGAAPATGVGLTVAANSFRSSGYVDGYRVAETQAPGHTYAANSDTYWDLGRDGVWRAVVVTSGASEPALTSSPVSVRVFRVRTNGSDRTAIVDRRRSRVALSGALDILAGVRLGPDRDEFTAATSTPMQDSSGAAFVLLHEFTTDPGGVIGPVRIYATSTGATPRRLVITEGAEFTGGAGNPWLAEIDDPTRIDIRGGEIRSYRAVGIAASDSFNDSRWADVAAGSDVVLGVRGSLAIGNGLANDAVPWIDILTAGFSGALIPVMRAGATREYVGTDVLGLGPGKIIATNAEWDNTAAEWTRIASGDAHLFVIARAGGVRTYYRLSGEASPWVNSGWSGGVFASDRVRSQVPVEATRFVPTANPGTVEAHGLYRANTPKAWAEIAADGSGGVALRSGFGVAGVSYASNTVTIELSLPMTNATFAVVATYLGGGGTNPLRLVVVTGRTASGGGGGGATVALQQVNVGADPSVVLDPTTGAAGSNPFSLVVFGHQ